MVDKRVDALAGREVPQLDRVIVRPGSNQTLIRSKCAGPDPIIVRINGKEEFTIGYLVDLERLVVRP